MLVFSSLTALAQEPHRDVHSGTRCRFSESSTERWQIESFNTLKTKSYNLEYNFGHGKQHLPAVIAILNLLAFASHTAAELTTTGILSRRLR